MRNQRKAKITSKNISDPKKILNQKGLIQAIALPQQIDLLL
ncbi:hypothetical protein CU005_2381 [Enterococcus faecium]|nr:hypothetical protein [Enterococcus faecium]